MELRGNNENALTDVTNSNSGDAYNTVINNEFQYKWSTVYYGVYVPSDGQICEAVGNVFTDKIEALQLVKRHKKARFKAFYYYHEAAEFALQGAEFSSNTLRADSSKKTQDHFSPVVEKYQFRGPKSQDLVKLRKGIEAGDLKYVESTIWDNPRYLISSGDTPSILQEGFRYNALHVAAKSKSPDMCELILNTVSNLDFVELLYGDGHENSEERAKTLLDLYLNTPDKGLNETPLHFAVKFGALKVVEILVSFPQCDKMVKNKYGKLPSQIICDRCDGHSSEKMKNDISMLLKENYYVPVLRSEDNCNPPVIGEPFSPTSPPNFNTNLMNPRVEIHAYAGPMTKKGAETFRKVWKTPPRLLHLGPSSKTVSSTGNNSANNIAFLKLKDHEKGMEVFGRDLAAKYEVDWKEYWSFLGCFVDLASAEGLQQLESFFRSRNNCDGDCNFQEHVSVDSSLQEGGESVVDTTENTISPLCRAFESLHISTNNSVTKSTYKLDLCPFSCIEKACQVFAHRITTDILHFRESKNNASKVLETQMKFLEQLMLSYLDDERFNSVNLRSVHARLGCLILYKLIESDNDIGSIQMLVEKIRASCGQSCDCFSSDDESVEHQVNMAQKNSTSSNKQLLCVLGFISNAFTNVIGDEAFINCEEEYRKIWEGCAECTCIWQIKNSRKCSINKRNSQKIRTSLGNHFDNVSRRLSFDFEDIDIEKSILKQNVDDYGSFTYNTSYDSSSDDEFYTPPSSPLSLYCSDEELYDDSRQPEQDIFIEGNMPTKVDHDVFMALKYAKSQLNPKDYPNLYRWYHTVSLYSEEQQKSWLVSKSEKCVPRPSNVTSTPLRNANCSNEDCQHSAVHASPKSWFRITGVNAPRASLQTYKTNIIYNV